MPCCQIFIHDRFLRRSRGRSWLQWWLRRWCVLAVEWRLSSITIFAILYSFEIFHLQYYIPFNILTQMWNTGWGKIPQILQILQLPGQVPHHTFSVEIDMHKKETHKGLNFSNGYQLNLSISRYFCTGCHENQGAIIPARWLWWRLWVI